MKQPLTKVMLGLLVAFLSVTSIRFLTASDHDDGESDSKARALNLTDHYAWKDANDSSLLNLAQSSNPRSMPGFQYYFSTKARYEMHVSRVSDKTRVPTGANDVVFRFEFGSPNAQGVQPMTFGGIEGGSVVGSHSGSTTNFSSSRSGTLSVNNAVINGKTYKYFSGLREDTFHFDVQRFFQVRNFLANTFIGYTADTLPLTCDGKSLGQAGGDGVHLFNPPSCAPDFTKNYNVNSIVLQAKISELGQGVSSFDTWSTISVPK